MRKRRKGYISHGIFELDPESQTLSLTSGFLLSQGMTTKNAYWDFTILRLLPAPGSYEC